jgi:hypothetical protein
MSRKDVEQILNEVAGSIRAPSNFVDQVMEAAAKEDRSVYIENGLGRMELGGNHIPLDFDQVVLFVYLLLTHRQKVGSAVVDSLATVHERVIDQEAGRLTVSSPIHLEMAYTFVKKYLAKEGSGEQA